jgi:hypothetical protein
MKDIDIVERKDKIIKLVAGGFDSLETALGLSLDFVKDFCSKNQAYKNQVVVLSFKLRSLIKEKKIYGTDSITFLNNCGNEVSTLLNILDMIEDDFINPN